MKVKFYFTYNNEKECVKAIALALRSFNYKIESKDLMCDDSEGVGSVYIPSLTQEFIEEVMLEYDDDVKVIHICDELIISTLKMFKELGV